ncbi:MAG: PEP/pyruvate-binding domain-containing protein [Myxococcales bacterium]|nr:PEP/pyruvate-binding domain-containing protein [Myxococcales bacterium]
MIANFDDDVPAEAYGGKAAQLARAWQAGLPVPAGFALSAEAVERVLANHGPTLERLLGIFAALGPAVAVRSSAIGEDGEGASFAGQHATVLNVRRADALVSAFREVHASGATEAALGYRQKLGLPSRPMMAVVVQVQVPADRAGVLFTKNPVTAADERVIEASYGLGEVVVQGIVTPDYFRVARGGAVLERRVGDKDLKIVWNEHGGTREEAVEPEHANVLCLDDRELGELDSLATECENHFGGTQDLEWAFTSGKLHLLQRRAITSG